MKKIFVTILTILFTSGIFYARQKSAIKTTGYSTTFLLSNTEKLDLKYTRRYKMDIGQADVEF